MRVHISQQTKWNNIYRSYIQSIETGSEHKNHIVDGFTKKYGVNTLVWYEIHETMESAIRKEKAIKNWKREWKINVIEENNAQWCDLYDDLL